MKRAILIVLDGFGVGQAPDAKEYGDEGSNTLAGIYNNTKLNIPNMKNLGIYNIDGINLDEKLEKTIRLLWKSKRTRSRKKQPYRTLGNVRIY